MTNITHEQRVAWRTQNGLYPERADIPLEWEAAHLEAHVERLQEAPSHEHGVYTAPVFVDEVHDPAVEAALDAAAPIVEAVPVDEGIDLEAEIAALDEEPSVEEAVLADAAAEDAHQEALVNEEPEIEPNAEEAPAEEPVKRGRARRSAK